MASVTFNVMYKRLCYANKKAVVKTCHKASIIFLKKEVDDHHCNTCQLAKATDFIPKKTLREWYHLLKIVAVNVIEYSTSYLSFRYTIHFIDVATSFY